MGGDLESEGTVELCTEGRWEGSICDDGWGVAEAAVICRQLGYSSEGQCTLHDMNYKLYALGSLLLRY